jgi:hypothetical protein
VTEQPDTLTMTGAQFQRYAGTDPKKWAEALLRVQAHWDAIGDVQTAERLNHIAQCLRDFADACVAEELGRVTARLVPRHDD